MAKFDLFAPKLLKAEGGWSDRPNDTPTMRGITLAVYVDYMSRKKGLIRDKNDLKNLTKAEALEIYRSEYWDKIKGQEILSQDIAETYMDMAVNSGVHRATSILQKKLVEQGHNLLIDGIMGFHTLGALNSNKTDDAILLKSYNDAREEFYRELARKNPTKYASNLKGWLKRLDTFRKTNFRLDKHNYKNYAIAGVAILATIIIIKK